jgi:lipid-A-disaccharide synthase
MKYYIIAGEASGDLHASNLMREMKKMDSMASFRFWGGDLMVAEGGQLVRHYRDTAYMGFFEVVTHLPSIFGNIKKCKVDIQSWQPDVVILVDYPGFNLRIAKFAKEAGFKVFYYIAPKIWAWNQSRVHTIRKYVDKVFTILPFETDFYAKYDVPVVYSGNPLLDALENRSHKKESLENFVQRTHLSNQPIIALLAGSRKQEIDRLLPEMLSVVKDFPDYQFVVAGAPSFNDDDYATYVRHYSNVKVLFGETYSLLVHARASLITSGTATLEAALLRSPQVVCYKMWGGSFTDFMAKKVIIKVPFISLVNLIMNREVVKELFQSTFSQVALRDELYRLCHDDQYRRQMLNNYEELALIMGGAGSSGRTARLMWETLRSE